MTKKMKLASVAAVAIIGFGSAGLALAKSDNDKEDATELKAFLASPITLSQAISRAEVKTGARAMSAEFDDEDGKYIYEVELATVTGSELEVLVDAQNGTVIKVQTEAEQKAEDNDEGDDEDDDDND